MGTYANFIRLLKIFKITKDLHYFFYELQREAIVITD